MNSFSTLPINTYFRCNPSPNVFVKIEPRNVLIEGRMRLANAFDLTANRLVNIDGKLSVVKVYATISAIEGIEKV